MVVMNGHAFLVCLVRNCPLSPAGHVLIRTALTRFPWFLISVGPSAHFGRGVLQSKTPIPLCCRPAQVTRTRLLIPHFVLVKVA